MDYTGFCKKCGQGIFVDAIDQDDADIKATQQCDCEQIEKIKRKLAFNLHQICGEDSESYGLEPVKPEVLALLEIICNSVAEQKIEAAKLVVDETDVTVKCTTRGCAISRNKKRSVKLEA